MSYLGFIYLLYTDTPNSSSSSSVPFFYIIIGIVGLIIAIVVVIAFSYQCVVIHKYMKRQREELEE